MLWNTWWLSCFTPIKLINTYLQIEYKAIQKAYDTTFDPSEEVYIATSFPPNPEGLIHSYTIEGLNPSSKYQFKVSGRTSAGSGEFVSIGVFTKAFTGNHYRIRCRDISSASISNHCIHVITCSIWGCVASPFGL